jgi:hypothetical protein
MKEARARFACGVLVDMRERGMHGLHELVLEFAFGAWRYLEETKLKARFEI